MIENYSILAIIPARGGSKGLSRKNILPLLDKPLIAWTIEAAGKSKYIDKYIVSTDDDEIANIASSFNCEVPFLRPKHLASDEASSINVIRHSIDFFKSNGTTFNYTILLEPTSPLRDSEDIDSAIEILFSNKDRADSIVGVSKVEATHPAFNVKIDKKGLIQPYNSKKFNILRRQDIEELYFFEGSVYISLTDVLLDKESFYHERTLPYVVPRWKSLEIDELVDLIMAEALLKKKNLLNRQVFNE